MHPANRRATLMALSGQHSARRVRPIHERSRPRSCNSRLTHASVSLPHRPSSALLHRPPSLCALVCILLGVSCLHLSGVSPWTFPLPLCPSSAVWNDQEGRGSGGGARGHHSVQRHRGGSERDRDTGCETGVAQQIKVRTQHARGMTMRRLKQTRRRLAGWQLTADSRSAGSRVPRFAFVQE